MTQLATSAGSVIRPVAPALPVLPKLRDLGPMFAQSEADRSDRAAGTDSLIQLNRDATPQSALDQRSVKRLSISELNQLDIDKITARLKRSRFDTRPAVVKVLDLIDLPRNTLFNIVAPGMGRRARERGEFGTFGQGKVFTSDVLAELGIENRVARGLLGFVGDVAFDPLTYVGGAGFGLRVAGRGIAAGRGFVDVGLRGRRAIKGSIRDVSRGAAELSAAPLDAVRHGTIRDMMIASGMDNDALLRRSSELTAAGKSKAEVGVEISQELHRRLIGDVGVGAVERGLGVIGGTRTSSGGIIGNMFAPITTEVDAIRIAAVTGDSVESITKNGASIAASRAFVQQYGKGAGGLRIGPKAFREGAGGSGVLHVPFTELEVVVPGFTAAGKVSQDVQRIASVTRAVSMGDDASRVVQDFGGALTRLNQLANEEALSADEYGRRLQRIQDTRAQAQSELEAATSEINANTPELARISKQELAKRVVAAKPGLADGFKSSVDGPSRLRRLKMHFTDTVLANGRVIEGVTDGDADDLLAFARMKDLEGTMKSADVGGVHTITASRLEVGDTFSIGDANAVVDSLDDELGEVVVRVQQPDDVRDLAGFISTEPGRAVRFHVNMDDAIPVNGDSFLRPRMAEAHERASLHGARAAMMDEARAAELEAFREGKSARLVERNGILRPHAPVLDAAGNQMLDASGNPMTAARNQGDIINDAIRAINVDKDPVAAAHEISHLRQLQVFAHASADRISALQKVPIEDLERNFENLAELTELSNAAKDAFSDSIAAAKRMADASGGSIMQHMNSQEKAVVRSAQLMLGTSDATQGASILMPIASAVGIDSDSSMFEWALRVDLAQMRATGRRGNHLNSVVRFAQRGNSELPQNSYLRAAHEVQTTIKEIAAATGIEDIESLKTAALAVLYEQRHLSAVGEGVPGERFFANAWKDGVGEIPLDAAVGDETIHNIFVDLARAQRKGIVGAKDGALSGNGGAEAMRLLREAANDPDRGWIRALDTLGELGIEDESILSLMAGHVPNIVSADGTRALAGAKRSRGFKGSGGVGGTDLTVVREQFQKMRTTTQYRFQDETGKWHRFFEFQRAYEGADIASFDPQIRAEVQRVQDAIKRYDALDPLTKPVGRPTDASELNGLVNQGFFKPITGSAPMSGFFESSIVNVMAARSAQAQRAHTRASFAKIATELGFSIDKNELLNYRGLKGRQIIMENGVVAEVAKGEHGLSTVKIGNQRFRELDPKIMTSGNPIADMMGDAQTRLFTEDAAMQIERVAQSVGSPKEIQVYLDAADKITGIWKSATLMHPAWQTTEIVSNILLFKMLGGSLTRLTARMREVVPLLMRELDEEYLAKTIIQTPSGPTTAKDLFLNADVAGLTRVGLTDEAVAQTTVAGMGVVEKIGADTRAVAPAAQSMASAVFPSVKRIGAGVSDNFKRSVYAPWFKLNRKINSAFRISSYLALLDEGSDAASAAERTLFGMFDFEDMTKFEKNIRRFVLPFYSWLRGNWPYQMKMLFERPAYAASVPKVQSLLEDVINGDDRVPQHMRPGWMRDQIAIQIGRNPEKRWSILTRSALPMGDAFEVMLPIVGVDGMQDFLHNFVSAVNPVPRAVAELATRREFFSGRKIGPNAEEGDVTVPGYLLKQVRPLSELFVQLPKTIREHGAGAAGARVFLGGRSQGFSEERIRQSLLFEFKDMEDGIRRSISRAERAGNTSQSLTSRVHLMALYREMMLSGLTDEVPKWARLMLFNSGALEDPGVPETPLANPRNES